MSSYGQTSGMRSAISYEGGNMVITTPQRKVWLQTGFLLFWLGGWATGEIFAVITLFGIATDGGLTSNGVLATGGFMVLWLTLWTFAGIFVIYQVLLRLAGRQVIRVNEFQMAVERRILGVRASRTKVYESALISGFRASDSPLPAGVELPAALKLIPFKLPGYLLFTFGGSPVRIEMPDSEEARAVYEQITSQYRIYQSKTETSWE